MRLKESWQLGFRSSEKKSSKLIAYTKGGGKIKEGLNSAVAEAAGGPVGVIQIVDHLNSGLIDFLDYQLGQAVSPAYGIGVLSLINDRQSELSPVIGVDGARAVDQADPML